MADALKSASKCGDLSATAPIALALPKKNWAVFFEKCQDI